MEITQGVHPRAKKFDRVGSNFGVLASNPLIRTELRENQGFGPAERKITNRSTSSRNTVFPVDNNASHGLYVQAMDLVNGSGRFSTLHISETPQPIFMKLEIYKYFPDTTLHAKFQGATSTWVV